MDRMGLYVPAYGDTRALEITVVTEAEYEFDLEVARAAGCITMHSDPANILSRQHLAIHPETGGVTMWWSGLADTKQYGRTDDGMMVPMKAHGTARIDGLEYGGIYSPPSGRLSFLRPFQYHYGLVEDIQEKDKVALRDGEGKLRRSHPIHTIDRREN